MFGRINSSFHDQQSEVIVQLFQKRKIISAAVIAVVLSGIYLTHYGYFWWNFKRINHLTIIYADRQQVALSVPVRYTTARPQAQVLGQLSSNDKKIYLVRMSPDGKRTLLSLSRWGWGGLSLYHAVYEITSPQIEWKIKKLVSPD